jgi:putative transposase
MSLMIAVVVLAGDIQDVNGARLLLSKVKGRLPRFKHIWADASYTGTLIEWVRATCNWALEIVRVKDKPQSFQVQPHRWVVERTFAWLGKYRRLSKDYEYLTESSEAMIYLAMTHIMLRRLTRQPKASSP